jgi:hypothetical protein
MPDGTETRFIPSNRPADAVAAEQDGLLILWSTTAVGSNDAMRQMYRHLGWGDYEPMLRSDGTPYPADEDDQFAGPDHL